MLRFLKAQANTARTENGAAAFATTRSACLDLFAVIGAVKNRPESEITKCFMRAYAENPDLAVKIMFFARDVRGGLGERRVFRVLLRWLAEHARASVCKNIPYIAEYGRFDDLLALLHTSCQCAALDYIRSRLQADLAAMKRAEPVSLLAKWLPSINASNPETVKNAKIIACGMGMRLDVYRKTLSQLRAHIRIIENDLRRRDYTFDYEKQPAGALYKYRAAFLRNDRARYDAFLDRAARGEVKMHTETLLPYQIIEPFFKKPVGPEERRAIDVTWNALADFTGGENALAVVDGSGSMYCGGTPMPATVAQSLGIYFAQRNTGAFRDHFITFSENPRLVQIQGRDIYEKARYCASFNECANTNIQKVFELILHTAVRNRLPQSELPSALYILSDMEFDCCAQDASATNFAYAKALYARYKYTLPRVVFWNVASRSEHQPVTMNEQGVTLVSGCSPRIFGMLQAGALSPYAFMMQTLASERYAQIAA